MKIVIPGGAGYCGKLLADHFTQQGHDVTVISRGTVQIPNVEVLKWDGKNVGAWADSLDGADVVINLAGRSVNCRYNEANRAEIYASRLDSTKAVGQAIASCKLPPKVWLNASTATIYRHADDRPMDEHSGEIGTGFSVDVAQRWEREFFDAATPNTRKVALRSAMVFSSLPGGVWDAFAGPARLGLAGPMAGGRQYVSWIHGDDFCRAIDWLISREDISGPVNIASPTPLTNREFLRDLRKAVGTPIGIPAPKFVLEIVAGVLKTETELMLKSRWVVPTRLLESGFTFDYPVWSDAANQIAGTKRPAQPLAVQH